MNVAIRCCSAISPCAHQRQSPNTVCETCQSATHPWLCAGCGKPSARRERVCDCPTACLFRYDDGKMEHEVKVEQLPQENEDLAYLEQAEAHADEGPLGEVAARSILKIALRNTRALIANASSQ